jgi:hypothetical protein
MTQPEFHRRYEAYPGDTKIELIGGIVHMSSPQRLPHGRYQIKLGWLFYRYEQATPGVEGGINNTTILGEESEPQPDVLLRVLPEYGGQSRNSGDQYIVGAPELMSEIAHSTVAIDMHRKRDDYQRAGVCEYLVVCLEEEEIHWFDFRAGKEIQPTRQGIYRSRVFPGLWIDGPALFEGNSARLMAVLNQGLASREHLRFVKQLQRRRG